MKDDNISKDNKSKLNESEKINDINILFIIIFINLKPIGKKKIALTNINKEDKNSTENKMNDNTKQEKEVKQNILDDQEYKNNHSRNNETLAFNPNSFDKDNLSIEQKSTNITKPKRDYKNIQIKFSRNKQQESFNSNTNNKIHLTDSNKLLIPVNYNIKLTNSEISILSIKKKFNKTFSNFPKINKDLADNKTKLSNYMVIPSVPTTRENFQKH